MKAPRRNLSVTLSRLPRATEGFSLLATSQG